MKTTLVFITAFLLTAQSLSAQSFSNALNNGEEAILKFLLDPLEHPGLDFSPKGEPFQTSNNNVEVFKVYRHYYLLSAEAHFETVMDCGYFFSSGTSWGLEAIPGQNGFVLSIVTTSAPMYFSGMQYLGSLK